ncbi:type III secretion protein [Pseudomonas sp. HN11]|uniref:type III secretion protein n=1 Tax=Pseudomonas sp. HN11 TaxID=1344094 RepID=UPI001F25F0C5|nr:type III secretion protein [Pseudomonas sp. HN11]UII72259.1 type III secretion protein [Pseudomonas sp. HN11]
MDFFKEMTDSTARNKRSAYKEYESGFLESLAAQDGEWFINMLMRRDVTHALFNEHGKTIKQMLTTTFDSFQ